MEDSIDQERGTINGLFINLDGRFHRPRKSDYQGFIVSNWMEDSIGQERGTIKALLYQTVWKIPYSKKE